MKEDNLRMWAVVGVALVKDGKVLFLRRANTPYMEGWLGFPGGHISSEESPRQAAVREVYEETGLQVPAERLEFLCVYARLTKKSSETETVGYEFVLKLQDDEVPENTEPHRCSELAWCDPNNLPDDVINEFKQVMRRSLLGNEKYLELGYE